MSGEGQHVPGYTEIKVLGTGSQGRVVLARHEATGRPVAIKYLAPELLGDTASVVTFRAEAALLQRVIDPHVTQLLAYLETPQGPAIVMEAVPGHSLRQVLDKYQKPLAPETALGVLKGSLLGLAAAHSAGVVHRDYKPANVLVTSDGQSKLIDFGVAVLNGQSGIAGTPSYMAPEQWLGFPSSPATDIYAATCVFVECVTGVKPYVGTVEELQTHHVSSPLPLGLVPEPLRPLAARGLVKNPAERTPSAARFVAELEAVATRVYGPDWERRGLIALGTVAALLGTAVPAVLLGSAVLAPATSTVGGGVGSVLAGQGGTAFASGHTAAATGKGVLAKLGGTKGAVGVGGTSAAVVVAGVLLWPSAPEVGGEARGSVRASFGLPGVLLSQPSMPASETPYMNLGFKVVPARVRPGTPVKMIIEFRARMPQGVKYLPGGTRQCFGEKSKRSDVNKGYGFALGEKFKGPNANKARVYFHQPASKNRSPFLPGLGTPVLVDTKTTGESQPYTSSICAYLSRWTETRTFAMPPKNVIKPGRYIISAFSPLTFSSIRRNGTEVPPASVGAIVQGTLPVITVLDD